MPGQTQMQASFGTGAVAGQRQPFGMRAPANPMSAALQQYMEPGAAGPAMPTQTPGVDPAWARIFGTATPSTLLERRAAGAPLVDGASAPSAAASQGADAQPLAPPDGTAPGADNGFSREKQMGGQSNEERGGPPTNPMTEAIQKQMPQGAQPGVPQAGPTPVPMPPAPPMPGQPGGPPMPPVYAPGQGPLDNPNGPAAPPMPPKSPQELGLAPPPGRSAHVADGAAPQSPITEAVQAAAGEMSAQGQEPGAPVDELPPTSQPRAAAGEAPNQTTAPAPGPQGQGQPLPQQGTTTAPDTYSGALPGQNTSTRIGSMTRVADTQALSADGQYNASGWFGGGKLHSWSNFAWVNPNTGNKTVVDPLAAIDANPTRALTSSGFWSVAMGVNGHGLNRLPDPATYQASGTGKIVVGTKLTQQQMQGYPAGVVDLLNKTQTAQEAYDALSANVGTDASGAARNQLINLAQTIRVGTAALGKYDINWQAKATPAPPAGGDETLPVGGGVPPVVGGGTTPGGGSTSPTTPGPGEGGNPAPNYEGTNLENADTPAIAAADTHRKYMNIAMQMTGGDLTAATALVEQMMSIKAQLDANANKQSGTNIIGNADAAAQNDPNRAKIQQLQSDILDNPDPTDYETIRNQYVGNQDKLSENIVQNLSAGAARRGLSAGAVQGMQSQAQGVNANQTAKGLGDLSIQESKGKRAAMQNAIASGNQGYQLFQMGDVGMANNLAGYIADPARAARNPLEGFLNQDLGQTAASTAEEAAGDNTSTYVAGATSLALLALMI